MGGWSGGQNAATIIAVPQLGQGLSRPGLPGYCEMPANCLSLGTNSARFARGGCQHPAGGGYINRTWCLRYSQPFVKYWHMLQAYKMAASLDGTLMIHVPCPFYPCCCGVGMVMFEAVVNGVQGRQSSTLVFKPHDIITIHHNNPPQLPLFPADCYY